MRKSGIRARRQAAREMAEGKNASGKYYCCKILVSGFFAARKHGVRDFFETPESAFVHSVKKKTYNCGIIAKNLFGEKIEKYCQNARNSPKGIAII